MRRLLATLTVAATVLVCLLPLAASAQQPAAAPTSLQAGVQLSHREGLSDYLTARLRTTDGTALGDEPVTFYVQTEIAGSRWAAVGTATTDASGLAMAPFTARQAEYTVKATFGGNADYGASEVTRTVSFPPDHFTTAISVEQGAALLAPVRSIMPPLISGLVAVLWIALIVLGVATATGVRRRRLLAGAEEQVMPTTEPIPREERA